MVRLKQQVVRNAKKKVRKNL